MSGFAGISVKILKHLADPRFLVPGCIAGSAIGAYEGFKIKIPENVDSDVFSNTTNRVMEVTAGVVWGGGFGASMVLARYITVPMLMIVGCRNSD